MIPPKNSNDKLFFVLLYDCDWGQTMIIVYSNTIVPPSIERYVDTQCIIIYYSLIILLLYQEIFLEYKHKLKSILWCYILATQTEEHILLLASMITSSSY